MAKKGGLGAGLNALFREDSAAEAQAAVNLTLPISRVEPRKDQPRGMFDETALDELADSIRQYGLIQPITVRALDSGYYQIIAGERRWRAARAAGLTEVPVRVIQADDRRVTELALVENLQREDLNPIEEARGYRTLMEDYGLTQEDAGAAVGKSRPAVANALRLLSLSAPVLKLVEEGTLSAGHARALIPVRDPELQKALADTVIARRLSVRQTETLAARAAKDRDAARPARPSPDVDYVREAERTLESALGRKVRLIDGRKKGRIEIEFYGADDREKLIENLLLFSSLRRSK
jgi:ParB family chromosome partitioning protein